jgi:cytidylate kinase
VSLPFVIALDGPAASGKSSVGLGAARALGLGYFDTGLLYRALTWLALQRGVESSDAEGLAGLVDQLRLEVGAEGRVYRDGVELTEALQQPAVSAQVSTVSAHAQVRAAMRPAQRELVRPPGLVMAGRDIGTVIVPEAPLKIWLSASPRERARRRALQTGQALGEVLAAMQARDHLDASREVAPMAKAADAIELPTDGLPLETVINEVVRLARERGA